MAEGVGRLALNRKRGKKDKGGGKSWVRREEKLPGMVASS